MPSISEQTTIPSPLDEVWPLLSDPALVASCIPGAALAPEQSDGVWRGNIRVKFGPTVAVFRGEATLSYDHAAHRCTIEGRGIDQRGASRALASGIVVASPSGPSATQLAIDGTFTVTGPLETFANAGGVHLARALLEEFVANLSKVVAERRGQAVAPQPASASPAPAGSTAAAAPQPQPAPVMARELSATKLMWRAFLSWFRELFSKGKKHS